MIHRWFWCHANNGNPNVQNRMTIRTPLMQGPMFLLGAYWRAPNNTSSLEFGYTEGAPLGVPILTNGQGVFLETVFAPGVAPLPRPPFTRFNHALTLQDDTKVFQATQLEGFVPDFVGSNEYRDYRPLRTFIPIWAGCVCLSCTFTSTAGTGAVDVAFEVLEDILNVPEGIREALKGTDLIEFLGRLTEVAIGQNSLINLPGFLWNDPIFAPYPSPQIPELAKLYLPFIEGF